MRWLLILAAVSCFGQPPGSISGTVLDSASGRPVEGVEVTLDYTSQTATTGANGQFRFDKLEPGDYYLKTEKEGFAKDRIGGAPAVRLASGQAANLEIRLVPEAVVIGQVKNAKGEPASAMVRLETAGRFRTSVASTFAEGGRFRLDRLLPGTYVLSAQDSGRAEVRGRDYPIELAPGEKKPDVEIVLQEPRAPVTVKGSFDGEAPAGRQWIVTYEDLGGNSSAIRRNGIPDPRKNFTMELPAPGRYRLTARTMPRTGEQPIVLGLLELTVPEAGIQGVVIPASPIRSVRARLRWANGAAVANPGKTAFSLNPMEGIGILQHAKLGEDGWIVAPRVSPDRYSFLVGGLPEGTYVKSILAGGADITSRGLDLISGTAIECEIVIADDGGTVSGQVLDAAQRPVVGARIPIMPVTAHRPEQELKSRYALTDAKGQFSQSGIAPGEYQVSARLDPKVAPRQTIQVRPRGKLDLQFVLP